MSKESFKVGDIVTWKSQAGGVWTQKTGKVKYVLKPYQNPIRIWNDRFPGHRRMYDGLRPPDLSRESYLVEVSSGNNNNRMPKLYMPRPALLRKANSVGRVTGKAHIPRDPLVEDYEELIILWADDRGLLAGTTPTKQTLKLMEEAGELCNAMMLEDEGKIKDAIGDMLVVMVNLCAKLGMSLNDCIAAAWLEIKDRKGKMVNGSFVKE